MTNKNNFRWLEDDIYSSLVLKVLYDKKNGQEFYGLFEIVDVLETTGDELDIKTANIDDLTNLLTLGIVRFVNVTDSSDILDIPFRKLYELYKNGNYLDNITDKKVIPFEKLDVFSIIDGTVRNDLLVLSAVVNEVSDDLYDVMKIAYDFGGYSMQEKIDALNKITVINHRRLINAENERILK